MAQSYSQGEHPLATKFVGLCSKSEFLARTIKKPQDSQLLNLQHLNSRLAIFL